MKRIFLAEMLKFTLFFAVLLFLFLWFALSFVADSSTRKLADQVIANSIEKVKYDTMQYEILRSEFHASNISKVKTVAFMIAEDPSILNDNKKLVALRDILDVDEIYVSDEYGVGRWATADYGVMSFHEHEQMRPFLPALTDKTFVLSQHPMARAADGLMYQYSGAARLDKPGIVQVGMTTQRMDFFLQIGFLSKISDISPILDNGFVAIADRLTNKIVSFKNGEYIGDNVSYAQIPVDYVQKDDHWGRAIINGVDSFILTKHHGKYAYLAIVPYTDANKDKYNNIIIALLFVIIVLALMVGLVMYLLHRHILNGIDYFVDTVTEIAGGSLDKKVNLSTCQEFEVLSGSINGMVNSLKQLIKNEKDLVKETERLASVKSQFLARMSHEIRTPINVITGMAKVGADNPEDKKKILEVFNDINVSAKHLMSVINDILDMSKIEAGKLDIVNEPFSLRSNIEDIVLMMNLKAKESSLKFSVSMENIDNLIIIADKVRLNQVLINLLSNAIKFTSKDGHIMLSVEDIGRIDNKAIIQFSISDSGIGMTEEEISSLFMPFQQADSSITRRFGGTGLGLSISKSIIELMGGTIGLESKKGEGSIFSFTLSLELSDNITTGDDLLSCDDAYDFSNLRILIVDDVLLNRKVVYALLEDSGAMMEEAADGGIAVSMFEAAPENYYDIILMDIHMPDIDGYTATKFIRSSDKSYGKTIPIIAITADAFKETLDKVLVSGMNDYISKPIDYQKLCMKINKHKL